jgi:DNA invertase Pin-like site-specific DNA recombinase
MTPVISYLRVSTDRQEESGLGLEAQRRQIAAYCERKGYRIVHEYQEAASAGTLARPVLVKAIARLEETKYDARPRALVVSKLDRLARSTLDFAVLIERAQANDWSLAMCEPELDLSDPFGKAMATVIMAFAQLEREMISGRTRAGIASKRLRGEPVGRPKGTREIDEQIQARILREHALGFSYRAIANGLAADQIPTARGGKWGMTTIRRVVMG